MSYILQALAQSERERRNADTPELANIFDVEAPTEKGKGRRKLILGGLLILINTIVIALFVLFGNLQFGSKPGIPDTRMNEDISAHQQDASISKLSSPSAPEPGIATDRTTRTATAIQNKSLEDQATDYIKKSAIQDIPIEEPVIEAIPIMEKKILADKPAKVDHQQKSEAQDFSDLERVRTLPGIDMSVHAYSENVAERFVFINGQEYHEGAALADEGAKLVAITPEGVVVDFGNRRVLLSRIR